MGNPVDLNKLDFRLHALLKMLKQPQPYGEVASKVEQFITDYEHAQWGQQSLFRPECRKNWKLPGLFSSGEDPFATAWIEAIDEFDNHLVCNPRKDALVRVCVEALRFLLNSNTDFHRRNHTGQLENALSEYLALRGYEVGSPTKIDQQNVGSGRQAAKSRPRKRKPDPKRTKKKKDREARQTIEEAIHGEWKGERWSGGYQDYVDWKNENLPEGWPKLDKPAVERAVANVNRRNRNKKK